MVTVQVTFDIVVVAACVAFAVVSAFEVGLVVCCFVVEEAVLFGAEELFCSGTASDCDTVSVLSSAVKVLSVMVDVDEISVLLFSVLQPIKDKQSSIHMNNDIYFFIKKPPPKGQRYSRTFKILRFPICPKAEFYFRQVSRLKI